MADDPQHFQHLANAWDLFLETDPGDQTKSASVRWAELCNRFRTLSGCDLRVLQAKWDPTRKNDPQPPASLRCPDCPQDAPLCAATWSEHVRALAGQPAGVWHRCPCGRLCALLSACSQGNGQERTLTRLVSDGEVAETLFVSQLELAGLLASLVAHLGVAEEPIEERPAVGLDEAVAARSPLLRRTLACIDQHLGDPKLTVSGVAGLLGVNSSYLAHLFARQFGVRMTKYIAARRIELAKSMLATSELCVKRIAFRCGFTSASWFGQLFRSCTGVTPGQYRRRHTR